MTIGESHPVLPYRGKMRRAHWKTFFSTLILMMAFSMCVAAPGDLDTSFNGNGKLILDLPGDSGWIRDIALQADGKIVAVGWLDTLNPAQAGFIIIRLNADGSFDPSFGQGGIVTSGFGYQFARANSVALQNDGKLIVGGYAIQSRYATSTQVIIARYLPNGALDTSFHYDGFIEEFTGSFPDGGIYASQATSVAIQTDGKIVAVGFGPTESFVLRYMADGTRDRRFGHLGRAIISLAYGTSAQAVRIQPDQKLMIVGSFGTFPISNGLALRLQPHGKFDASFDSDGYQAISFGSGLTAKLDCQIQPDGKLVVVGYYSASETDPRVLTIAKLNLNGSFDNSFDGVGRVTIDSGGYEGYLFRVAIQQDGKIVVAGSVRATNSSPYNFLLMRRNSDGSPDIGFGQSGRVETNMSPNADQIHALRIQPDGRIVAAGFASMEGGRLAIAMARYLGE